MGQNREYDPWENLSVIISSEYDNPPEMVWEFYFDSHLSGLDLNFSTPQN